ncbi:hypothetical protein [Dactylosporangium sp. CA-092794]|uniref:hypothetical protein n=1 Tax=Dactylosporangium sp. CA-092794 TaxID=3239929 RepID=UPI003D8AB5BE
MLSLSVAYGAVCAILAVLDSSAIGTFAIVGAVVLGALWAIRGFFITRDRAR